jgi:tRNA (mo5U34)-methyltransferase
MPQRGNQLSAGAEETKPKLPEPGSVRKHSWYHTIDFPDGSASAGYYDTRGLPDQLEWPAGLTGGRCLDVGTFDGFWAFEMEHRGAKEVVALDVAEPEDLDWRYDDKVSGPADIRAWGAERGRGFREARDRLDSSVEQLFCSVYDLDPEIHGQFDVVFCGALLLHLRDPIRALERMRMVCSGELLLLETLDPALEIRARRIPTARVSVEHRDQWWKANSAGLAAMIDIAGFRTVSVGRRVIVPYGRGVTHPTKYSLEGLVALRPLAKGALMRPFRAVPRPPKGG